MCVSSPLAVVPSVVPSNLENPPGTPGPGSGLKQAGGCQSPRSGPQPRRDNVAALPEAEVALRAVQQEQDLGRGEGTVAKGVQLARVPRASQNLARIPGRAARGRLTGAEGLAQERPVLQPEGGLPPARPPPPPPGAGRGSGDWAGARPERRSVRSSALSLPGAALRTPAGPGSPASAQPPSRVRPPQPRVTLVLLTAGDGPCHRSRARCGGVGGLHATPRRGFPSTPDRGAVGNSGPNCGLSPNDRGL